MIKLKPYSLTGEAFGAIAVTEGFFSVTTRIHSQVFFTRILLFLFLLCFFSKTFAQEPDKIYVPNIHTVQLHMYGDQQSLPVYTLNSNEQLELNFDDMEPKMKSYYYSYQLCDYNWKPLDLSPFTYIKGFTQQRISTYRYSSIAINAYTHYQAMLPDRNSVPTVSGNYLLKVFLDGDPNKLVFTKRMLVIDPQATIAAQIQQPFSAALFKTHQKIQFNTNIKGLNTFSAAQQVKVVILQNNRWDNAVKDITPTFVRGTTLEYNTENISVFPGGKEWRWLDLRSFRLQSDRVDSAHYRKDGTDIFLKPDIDRSGQKYVYYRDLNGTFSIESFEAINPLWQGDYANVKFTYVTPNGKPYPGKDLYLSGQLTGYQLDPKVKMTFNDSLSVYEGRLWLKQGYYNYAYVAVDQNDPSVRTGLEGNYFETENNYTILVYYKSFTDRSDKLVGIGRLNSRTDRPGFSF